jgi:hypothetical protein
MKKLLLFSFVLLAVTGLSFGQDTLVDFETVQNPLVEPFDLTSYENAVANPDGEGFVGKAVKAGCCFWGGINIYFGGDVAFTGADTFKIDFYAANAGTNDSILFKFQLFNRYGGVQTVEVDRYYSDANDTEVGVWKTLEFALPDTMSATSGSYNQMVIFFGWNFVADGDEFYFDNVVAPGFTPYGNTDVTFTITDKFNNATDVKLFIDGNEATLTQAANVYTNTSSLVSYTVLEGQDTGIYEIVYSHLANGVEVRDTTSLVCGSPSGAQELVQLIIVEALEDGTALAISVGETPPVIDGAIDAVWDNARTHTMQQRSWWGNPTGLYSTWKVMWDIDNVYLLYVVEDATPYNGNTAAVYENDCIETFFDMNQSAKEGYDADDWQIRSIRMLDSWTGSANVDSTWGSDVQRAQASMPGDAGYHVEMAIPWLSLSNTFLPLVGKEFNYDCVVADVGSGGGARLYRESWTTDTDVAYFNTEFFGTITLSADTIEGGPTAVFDREEMNVTIYPNPASDQVSISSDVLIDGYTLLDMTGRMVRSASAINEFNAVLNVSDLNEGVYIIRITDIDGASSVQRLQIH